MRCRHERVIVFGAGLTEGAREIVDGRVVREFQHGRSDFRTVVMCRLCGLERSARPWRKTPRWVEAALALVDEHTREGPG